MTDQRSIDRLNASERQILLLLVEGHTSKSIAATLGLSVNAVNERLREARRKTGAGSSRELARLLRTQENRDKQIGVPSFGGLTADPLAPGATVMARRIDQRSIFMIIAAAAGIGALALAQTTATPAEIKTIRSVNGPVHVIVTDAGRRAAKGQPPLEDQMRQEGVDASWAPGMEQRLKAIYTTFEGYEVTDARCAASICELDLKSVPGKQMDFMSQMSSADVHERFAAVGMGMSSFKVTTSPTDPTDRRYAVWMVRSAKS